MCISHKFIHALIRAWAFVYKRFTFDGSRCVNFSPNYGVLKIWRIVYKLTRIASALQQPSARKKTAVRETLKIANTLLSKLVSGKSKLLWILNIAKFFAVPEFTDRSRINSFRCSTYNPSRVTSSLINLSAVNSLSLLRDNSGNFHAGSFPLYQDRFSLTPL